MTASELRLRPVRPDDEEAALAAHEAMATDRFTFLLGYTAGESWAAFVDGLERHSRGIDLEPDRVRSVFLLATVGRELVGRSSIRFDLNDYLALAGGHIGFGVLRAHRRRGHATEMLRQSLVVARAGGVEEVLVTCAEDNVGSSTVIERCGGVFESVVDDPHDGTRTRRYWIH